MRRLPLILLGLLALGVARADELATGRFRLRVPEEAIRVARLTGKVAPSGRLSLNAGGVFVLQADGATRHGRYKAQGSHLSLIADDGAELAGEIKGERVTVEGLAFERETPLDLSGAWTVHRKGVEERGLRMELRADGKFRFSMAGATSEGTWSVADGKLLLVWSKIDGELVEPGCVVRKEISIVEDGGAFQIDTYRYERASPN